MKTLEKQVVPVVEVNLEPCVDRGYGLIIKEDSTKALPELFSELMKLK